MWTTIIVLTIGTIGYFVHDKIQKGYRTKREKETRYHLRIRKDGM